MNLDLQSYLQLLNVEHERVRVSRLLRQLSSTLTLQSTRSSNRSSTDQLITAPLQNPCCIKLPAYNAKVSRPDYPIHDRM